MGFGSIARYHTGAYDDAMAVANEIAEGARHRAAAAALLWADLIWAETAVRIDRLDEAVDRANMRSN